LAGIDSSGEEIESGGPPGIRRALVGTRSESEQNAHDPDCDSTTIMSQPLVHPVQYFNYTI